MWHIWVKVRIGSKDDSTIIDTQTLVDTGATLTVIPRHIVSQLGGSQGEGPV